MKGTFHHVMTGSWAHGIIYQVIWRIATTEQSANTSNKNNDSTLAYHSRNAISLVRKLADVDEQPPFTSMHSFCPKTNEDMA